MLPYGDVFGEQNTFDAPFAFAGEPYDQNGLTHLRACYYDSQLGRFFQIDPSRLEQNLYEYGKSNPMMNVDPSGLLYEQPLTCNDQGPIPLGIPLSQVLPTVCSIVSPILVYGTLISDTTALGVSSTGVVIELVGTALGSVIYPGGGDETGGFLAARQLYNSTLNVVENVLGATSLLLTGVNDIFCTRDTRIETVNNVPLLGVPATELVLGADTSFGLSAFILGNLAPFLSGEAIFDTSINGLVVYYDIQRLSGEEPFWGLKEYRIGVTNTGRVYVRLTPVN